jgi:hypothetical protein
MPRITLYHHPECRRCRRIARVHKMFNWLGRLRVSTAVPPTGPLRPGEIVAEDHVTGVVYRGIDAVRAVFRCIPAYTILRPLLHVPFVARRIDRETRGCADGSCAVPLHEAEVRS